MKYVEVRVNFPGSIIAEDKQLSFCVDGASEYNAVALAKEVIEQSGYRYHEYTGYTLRKDKAHPQNQQS